MLIGIITGQSTVPLFRVPSSVKINAHYYKDYVLKPFFTLHLPRLYPNEMDKVHFRHHKASNLTAAYLIKMKAELSISFINKDKIPVKAPNGRSLDFFGFGYLKQTLLFRSIRTLGEIWKLSRVVWLGIDLVQIPRVFNSWKRRLRY